MRLGTVLAGAAQLVLLLGVTALADPTYSVYSDPPTADGGTVRYGFNDFGSYVGWTYSGGTFYGFVIASDGTTSAITPPSSINTHPTGINDNNVVVGYFADTSGTHGFINSGGSYTTLNAPGATATYAYGINRQGQVVGYYIDKSGITHGFVETAGVFTTVDVPGAVATYGLAINDSGEVVGSYFDGTSVHGFTYSGGVFEVVDRPGVDETWLTGVDNAGSVVGWARTCAGCDPVSFVLSTDLFLAFVGSYPTDVNNWGTILGSSSQSGYWLGEVFEGSVVTKASSPVGAIPEPGTLSLAACGALALMLARRFRKKQ
jgi:probable HAF family extracellular repeat protein